MMMSGCLGLRRGCSLRTWVGWVGVGVGWDFIYLYRGWLVGGWVR